MRVDKFSLLIIYNLASKIITAAEALLLATLIYLCKIILIFFRNVFVTADYTRINNFRNKQKGTPALLLFNIFSFIERLTPIFR